MIFDNLLKIVRRKAPKKETSKVTAFSGHASNVLWSREKPMLLAAVFRCIDLLSDSLAVLPLRIFERDAQGFKTPAESHPLHPILDLEPNEDMTRYVLLKTMVASVLLKGNAYAYIERTPTNAVSQIIYIPASDVGIEFVRDHNGIYRKRYRVAGFKKLVEPKDMIHVMNFSYDGIYGVSTLTHAAQTLGIATSAEEHANANLRNGGTLTGVLTVEGPRLDKKQKDDIYQTWATRMNPADGSPSSIAVLEGNMKYQSVSISPKDSQLLESRQFQVIEIARFFGVSPVKLFDLSKSSYSTVEATQLQFLTDTLLPLITKFESEFRRKLLLRDEQQKYDIEFDTSVILRTDKKAESSYWRDMTYIGAATPNEIRKLNNLPPLKNGNTAFVQVNMQPLDHAVMKPIEPVEPTLNQQQLNNNQNE